MKEQLYHMKQWLKQFKNREEKPILAKRTLYLAPFNGQKKGPFYTIETRGEKEYLVQYAVLQKKHLMKNWYQLAETLEGSYQFVTDESGVLLDQKLIVSEQGKNKMKCLHK